MTEEEKKKKKQGFAVIKERDPELMAEIASLGGKAAQESGKAHQWTEEEAREAGKKGGESVSRDRDHMANIGRKGGEAKRKK